MHLGAFGSGNVLSAYGMTPAADAAEKEFGPIDLWINNAMVSMYSPFLEMLPEPVDPDKPNNF